MRRFTKLFSFAVMALSLPAIALGLRRESEGMSRISMPSGIEGSSGLLQTTDLPVKGMNVKRQAMSRVAARTSVVNNGFLYEDFFESGPDGDLPEGWSATSTPGRPDDIWHVGTLGISGSPVAGISDYKYAYILGDRTPDAVPHDAWLFTPKVHLEAGKQYLIEFYYIMMPANDKKEVVKVSLGKTPTRDGMTQELKTIENANDHWDWVGIDYSCEESGDYYIGFNSLSPAGGNGTMIDNVMISNGFQPFFYGMGEVDFGEVDNVGGHAESTYEFYNSGYGPLNVEFVEASEGLTVTGLPQTLEAYDYGSFNVSLDVPEDVSSYTGKIVITTNDPILPRLVEIPVVATITEGRVTDFIIEDFEAGGPEGWVFSKLAVNTALEGVPGHNGSSRVFYTETWNTMVDGNEGGVGFTTHYVNMGDNPQFSFWYNLANVDSKDNVLEYTPASQVKYTVEATADGGRTWETIYTVAPDSENVHTPNVDSDYIQTVVDLPQFKGKTCKFRLLFNNAGDAVSYRVLVDDVAIGTPNSIDLKSVSLFGAGKVVKGREYTFTGTVKNLGIESVDNYTVEMYDLTNCIPIATSTPASIAPGASETFEFKWTPTSVGCARVAMSVTHPQDGNSDNDISPLLWIDVMDENASCVVVDDGDAMASMAYPVNFNAYKSAAQTIYYANELGINRGDISSLSFVSIMEKDYLSSPFTVYIGETTQSNYESGEFIPVENLTPVFSGSIYFREGTNQFVIPFDKPFHYNGNNIVVMTHMESDEFIYNKFFRIREDKNSQRSIQVSSLYKDQGLENMRNYVNDAYPEIGFNMVKAPYGTLAGNVTCNGTPVDSVRVSIDGSTRYVSTSGGNYTINEIATGDYNITFSKHGYYTKILSASVIEGEKTDLNVDMTELPTVVISGTIASSGSSTPVPGAIVTLKGYDDYQVVTDESGHYSIDGVTVADGEKYILNVYSPFYDKYKSTVDITEDTILNISLDETLAVATQVKGVESNDVVMLTWDKPLPEFRHDSGIFHEAVGFDGGGAETIVGAAFQRHSKIKEVRWYVHNEHGADVHENFNVYIFGLKNGIPNAKDLRYVARNVEYVDDGWCSHVLTQPLDIDGYMVAISCDGFLAIGVSEPTEDYPFEEGQNYYAGDSYNFVISPMSSYRNSHFMIRACGDCYESGMDPDIARPNVTYEVYRLIDGDTEDNWTLVGTTDSSTLLDTNFASLNKGNYRYAVKAVYNSGKAEGAISNLIEKKSDSGIESVNYYDVIITPNPCVDSFTLKSDDAESICIVNLNGSVMLTSDSLDSNINMSQFVPGMYLILVKHTNGTVSTHRLLKK